jgi:hypothetical protein
LWDPIKANKVHADVGKVPSTMNGLNDGSVDDWLVGWRLLWRLTVCPDNEKQQEK